MSYLGEKAKDLFHSQRGITIVANTYMLAGLIMTLASDDHGAGLLMAMQGYLAAGEADPESTVGRRERERALARAAPELSDTLR